MIKSDKKNDKIIIKGAKEHNLKNIDLELPRNQLIVVTGVSGSGKSSLVFDTVYAEGQRRYVESLSSYARQFLERISKPNVDFIYGISPAVAIEQKTGSRNPRSTVGTVTEIYDYLRLIFSRLGKTYCFICNSEVKKDSVTSVSEWIEKQTAESKFLIGFPVHKHESKSLQDEIDLIKKRGYFRIFYNNTLYNLNEDTINFNEETDIFYIIIDRYKLKAGKTRELIADSIETAFKEGENRIVVINADSNEIKRFNKFFECCDIRYEEPEPRFFSFNNPFGACPVCQGFGKVIGIDPNLVIPNPHLSILEGAIAPWRSVKFSKFNRDLIRTSKTHNIPTNIPYYDLSEEHKNLIFNGYTGFIGINNFFEMLEEKTYKMHIRVLLSRYRAYTSCNACKGTRLRRESLQVKINKHSIADIVSMSIEKTFIFFNNIQLTEYEEKVGGGVLKEILKRLKFLIDVGLSYLTLDRLSSTLSGGETQRINLATSLGSALMGTLYVLDEPSIGLHPRDNSKLINILKSLRDLRNTVLVVEHDSEMMMEADLLIDMGPLAGENGGEIISIGKPENVMKDKNSLTGKYLSGQLQIPLPNHRNTDIGKSIFIKGARENNLKNIDVEIPLNKFVVITGVSGSGKSTLVHDILYGGVAKLKGENPDKVGKYYSIEGIKAIDEIEIVDQSPIGKSPRSNPISYVKGFEIIRELFANTSQAKSRGYKPGYFSFNIPGGRCETCSGDGYVKIEMQFMADLYLECEDCNGTRYKKETRAITYKGKNIVEVLNMSVSEALIFFNEDKKVKEFLRVLNDVGLGYIKLGQPSNTLSGGEAQRIKLAKHLTAQKQNKHTLFIFDEPTTGLHFHDIAKLLDCFNVLLNSNNSIVIIEHNLDVIKCADYIIDMGPEAGEKGGEIVATGTPEDICNCLDSHTGRYLKKYIS